MGYSDGYNKVDNQGKKQGLWISNFEGIRMEVYYKNGLQEGIYKTFYRNGKLNCIGEFQNDNPIGNWFCFDEQGHLLLKVTNIRRNVNEFLNEANIKIMPPYIYNCKYFNKNGNILEEGECISKDVNEASEIFKNGIWKQFNAAGKLEKTTNWRFGRIVLVNKKR